MNAALQPQVQAVTAHRRRWSKHRDATGHQADLRAKAQALADAESKLASRAPTCSSRAAGAPPARHGAGDRRAQRARRRSRRAARADNYDGFVSLFDGRTRRLNGDPMFWSVKDGALRAESTPEKVVGA